MYTIKFQPRDQDNLNFIPFKAGDQIPPHLDFEKVLASSIDAGYISDASEIKTLVDGSNHVEPYFTSLTAAEDCKTMLEAETDLTFEESKTVYEI